MAGFFGYELAQHIEQLPSVPDDLQFPDLAVGFYDLVIAFDCQEQRAWIFSSGYPEQEPSARAVRAQTRLQTLRQQTEHAPTPTELNVYQPSAKMPVKSNFTPDDYEQAVRRVQEYILAGDIFEANISQQFRTAFVPQDTPFDLYQRLRHINPAPFAAFLNFFSTTLVSASPERFLQLKQKNVETRPIKGTCARGQDPIADQAAAEALLRSEKDRAENVMIVDLLRNDLSRVCEMHSVNVPVLCGLETYATVHHLVSTVQGKLRQDLTALDLLRAAFPGGSITGAPKIRAMEIIAEIENIARGPYCGSIAYLGFDGSMDSSIVIRTFAIQNKIVTFQAGGAIVLDSEPNAEYEETLTKIKALIGAL